MVLEAPKMVTIFAEEMVTDWRRTRIEIWRLWQSHLVRIGPVLVLCRSKGAGGTINGHHLLWR